MIKEAIPQVTITPCLSCSPVQNGYDMAKALSDSGVYMCAKREIAIPSFSYEEVDDLFGQNAPSGHLKLKLLRDCVTEWVGFTDKHRSHEERRSWRYNYMIPRYGDLYLSYVEERNIFRANRRFAVCLAIELLPRILQDNPRQTLWEPLSYMKQFLSNLMVEPELYDRMQTRERLKIARRTEEAAAITLGILKQPTRVHKRNWRDSFKKWLGYSLYGKNRYANKDHVLYSPTGRWV
jgi:hypothetical protein